MSLVLLLSVAWGRPPSDPASEAFRDVLTRMVAVAEAVTDYTVRFTKQEWVDGAMTPFCAMEVKFRAPQDVYVRWVEGDHVGRQLLYRGPGWNGGKFKVDPGRFMPVISLSPDSRLAMSGNRHSLRDLPVAELVSKIVYDAKRVNDHPTWEPQVTDLGVRTVEGEPARCFDSTLPKAEDPTLYAARVELCVSTATELPNSVRSWDVVDGELRLVEDYRYLEMKLGVGLSDADFDPATYGL